MHYRKTLSRNTLIAWSTIAVILFMCSITLNNAQAKFLFKARIDYDTGDGPRSLAIGDLNGDGNLDLTVANYGYGAGEISVLLSNGDGSFQNAVNFAAGSAPSSVAIGDLNGDGNLDLAVANGFSDNVSVLLGNGDGSFQAAMNFGAGSWPYFIAIGDLNGDAKQDLAVANQDSDNVSVLLGNGDGTFQSAMNYAAGDAPQSVAIGDLNGDRNLDLAVANFHSDNISALLGNGDGSFQTAVNYAADDAPQSAAIGDLNGDGDLDLSVANGWSNNVSVLLGNGDGTFKTAVNYAAGNGSNSVAIGDLNGDGDLDLAVANQDSDNVSVLLGNGDGSFQTAVNYGTSWKPYSIVIGALNGDGNPDLAVANDGSGNVSVLLGNGDGSFQSEVNYAPGRAPRSVAISNLNGDDNLDLAVATEGYYTGRDNVSVLLGNGDGTFKTAVNYAANYGSNSVAIGNLNGDTNLDLAIAGWGGGLFDHPGDVSVLLGNGDGSFQSAVSYGADDEPSSVAIGNLNGDGSLDLAVANEGSDNVSVLLGNGDGSFQAAVNYGAGDYASSVAIGDFNGDGDLDLAVANEVSDNVSVLLGNGDGTFKTAVNYAADNGSNFVAIGNLNGDTNPDLAVANDGSENVSVLLGNGDGTFQDAEDYDAGLSPRSVAIGDLNGDGNPDLAVANEYSNNVSVLLGNGDGSFQTAVNYGAGDRSSSVAIGDLNGDGNLDLATANSRSNSVSVLINTAEIVKFLYTPVTPCRIVDTRKTSAAIIGASTQRDFRVYGSGGPISAQGGDPEGCTSPLGEPLAVLINMIAVDPTGKGNLQAFPVGAGAGAGLSVNYNAIDTNLANSGTVKTVTGPGADITVASNFSSTNTVIDVLGYYFPDEGYYYTPVDPCRIADTRKTSAGIIGASTQRDFRVSGPVGDQGGNPAGCPSTLGVDPKAAHINMVAVNPSGKGNLQAFPVGAEAGAGLSVNYNAIDTNLANAGTVKAVTGSGPDITVASNFSSAYTVIDILGYYSEEEDLQYTPVTPCRIVDTRKSSAGIIDANTEHNFRVFGSSGTISAQGGDSAGCSSPEGEPLAVHINMIAVDPTGKGNLQAFPVGAGAGAGLSVNYNTIDTNLANAGTVKAITGTGPDITVASNFSSAHTVIDVLGYYYSAP